MFEKIDDVCVCVACVCACEFINSVGRTLRMLLFFHTPYNYSPEIINVQQVLEKLAIETKLLLSLNKTGHA